MNSAARLINQQTLVSTWSLSFVRMSAYQLCLNSLIFSVLLSAITVVYMINMNRSYTQVQQHGLKQQVQMQVEYGQLLLEKGTLLSQTRIERIAHDQLNMYQPRTKKVIVVDQ